MIRAKFNMLGLLIEFISVIIIAVGLMLTTDIAIYVGLICLLLSLFCFVFNEFCEDE